MSAFNNERGDILEGLLKNILVLLIVVVGGYFLIGAVVDNVVIRIPVSIEKEIFSGSEFGIDSGKSDVAKSEMYEITKAESILKKIASDESVPRLEYRLFVMDDKQPNAVAVPGGGIGVTRGLLNVLDEDIALAFVLGHELGHFKNRDHLKGIGRSFGVQLLLTYFMGESDIGRVISEKTTLLMQRKYSRQQEEKADKYGLLLVYKAYGDVKGTTKLFEILKDAKTTPQWAYMLSTHPSPESRIENMEKYSVELKSNSNME